MKQTNNFVVFNDFEGSHFIQILTGSYQEIIDLCHHCSSVITGGGNNICQLSS
jgi:hypothetical protein